MPGPSHGCGARLVDAADAAARHSSRQARVRVRVAPRRASRSNLAAGVRRRRACRRRAARRAERSGPPECVRDTRADERRRDVRHSAVRARELAERLRVALASSAVGARREMSRSNQRLSAGERMSTARSCRRRSAATAATSHSLPLVVIRPGVIFGPGRSCLSDRVGPRLGRLLALIDPDRPLPYTFVTNCASAVVGGRARGWT